QVLVPPDAGGRPLPLKRLPLPGRRHERGGLKAVAHLSPLRGSHLPFLLGRAGNYIGSRLAAVKATTGFFLTDDGRQADEGRSTEMREERGGALFPCPASGLGCQAGASLPRGRRRTGAAVGGPRLPSSASICPDRGPTPIYCG